MQVVVAGGSGFVGRHLCEVLARRGDRVVVLTRSRQKATVGLPRELTAVVWDPARPESLDGALEGVDAVINLSGENVAEKRWNDSRKRALEESRVTPTRTLVAAIERAQKRPSIFINASAVGYYGSQGDRELTEADPPGSGYLANVCSKWEDAAKPAEALGVRLVLLRLGVVLAADGGAMEKMLTPFNYFVGGPLGSGKQWMPWVHRHDVSGLIVYALSNSVVKGPVNCTAPYPVTNNEFSRVLGDVMGRPSFMRAPEFALRFALGEMAEELLLASQRAIPKAALGMGYFFRYETVVDALKDIVGTYYSQAPNRWWPNQGKTVLEGRRIDEHSA